MCCVFCMAAAQIQRMQEDLGSAEGRTLGASCIQDWHFDSSSDNCEAICESCTGYYVRKTVSSDSRENEAYLPVVQPTLPEAIQEPTKL